VNARKSRPYVLALVVSCGLVLSSCANVTEAKKQADGATDRFHEQFNSEQFEAIYSVADEDFRKTGTAEQLRAFLQNARSQLGPFQRVARPGAWALNRTPGGTFVTSTNESTFARGAAEEMFVWRLNGTTCTLWKFTINNIRVPTRVVTAKRAARPVRFVPIHASLAHLQYLERYYHEQLGLDVELLPELMIDRAAWSPDRRQWSAEGLAEQIRQSAGNDDALFVGVTGEDMYLRTENWQFAFGWRLDNRVAVVSYARMDPQFFKQPENPDLLRQRLRHMLTKQLGLMLFDLEASADPASPVYRDIEGLEELDAMGEDLALAGFPVVTR
jgi:predicted Zn-dependent protease